MRLALVLIVGVMTTSSLGAGNRTALAPTSFRLGDHGEPLVATMVNGAGPFVFILDTGSTHSTVSDELARTLGAPAIAKTTVVTSLGEETYAVVRLDRVDVAGMTMANVLPSVVPIEGLDPQRRIDGVIGQDVLAGHHYTLDFENKRIFWHAAAAVARRGGLTLAMRFERERFLVDLPQRESILRLVPDSGAEGLVLFARADLQLPRLSATTTRVRVSTLSDQTDAKQVRISELRIGTSILREVPAVLLQRRDAGASEGDGLLPLNRFARVTFNGPERLLIVEPGSENRW